MIDPSKKDIKTMFENLCCSHCKNEFDKDSFELENKYGNLRIYHLQCKKCGKDFGQIILNYNQKSDKHTALEIIQGATPITIDDVIDAHKFIQNL